MLGSTRAACAICAQLPQLPHSVVSAACRVLTPWAAHNLPRGLRISADSFALKLLAEATALAAVLALLLRPLLEPALGLRISKAFAQDYQSLARCLRVAFLLLGLNVPANFLLLEMRQARFTKPVISNCGMLFVLGALALPRDFFYLCGIQSALRRVVALLARRMSIALKVTTPPARSHSHLSPCPKTPLDAGPAGR